jgi:hypothetical protein
MAAEGVESNHELEQNMRENFKIQTSKFKQALGTNLKPNSRLPGFSETARALRK